MKLAVKKARLRVSETSFSTKIEREVTLKAIFFDSGETFGLAAQFPDGRAHSVAFPSALTAGEVASRLRQLADWIHDGD